MEVAVTASAGHTLHAVRALVHLGWKLESVPDKAKLRRNGQLIRLKWKKGEKQLRLFIYKITGSGRNKHERRIEITTTYPKGLSRAAGYEDVVLGYDTELAVFVGIDPRRIEYGGKTGNASSFIDPEGVHNATKQRLAVLRRQAQIFGVEYQAYFKAERLAEYLFNSVDVHRGVYGGNGEFSASRAIRGFGDLTMPAKYCVGEELVLKGPESKRKKQDIRKQVLTALEEDDAAKLRNLEVSQEEFLNLARLRQEIGLRGEEIILKSEQRRLARAGKADLAARISWISQTRPFEGYDILSYEIDGRERCIEVKTTSGSGRIFPITENEWQVAGARGTNYFIYRVTTVNTKPQTKIFRDPIALEKAGTIKRCPLAWTIQY